jgi:outer membrane protein assembly factor BamB
MGEVAVDSDDFELASRGCPMAHCDNNLSDLVRLPAPDGPVELVWHREELAGERAGTEFGLGCSGNSRVVACSYFSDEDALVVYDYDGNRLWSSGDLFNDTARNSVPLLSALGEVIMADDRRVIRFAPDGQIDWQTPLPFGGRPVSPVLTDSGVLIMATVAGPVYAVDSANGGLLGTLFVRKAPDDPGFFETINTPAVRGNRVYVSMHHQVAGHPDPDVLAWLVAIDVSRGADNVLTVAWHYEFGGFSGASPTRIGNILLFDGDRPKPGTGPINPHLFAVVDTQDGPVELWRRPTSSRLLASVNLDPRPPIGLWHFIQYSPYLIHRSILSGRVKKFLNVNKLLGVSEGYVVSSATSIAGAGDRPVMLVTASLLSGGPCYLLAVDLARGSLLWKLKITEFPGDFAASQFPILMGEEGPRLILTSFNGGARAVGAAPIERERP